MPYQKAGDPTRLLKLFVSYRRKSWPFTNLLAADLGQRVNAEIFVDISGVDKTNFERSILRHLDESDAVLLVVSEHTFSERIQQSEDWVRREVARALEGRKAIVMVLGEGLAPLAPEWLPERIREVTRMQGIPFYPEYWEVAVERLADFLTKVTTAAPAHAGGRARAIASSTPLS